MAALIAAYLVLSISNGALAAPRTNSASSGSKEAGVLASQSERVDLDKPTFSDPTSITNPLFPISGLAQVIQLGEDADGSLKHEITLLPRTKTIEWKGQKVETLVSQFVGYQNGRILEVAVDFFAQADDGSVWYFGENVDNYAHGVVADHEGTWLAGKDGPPGMIMPAHPQVGDVYRPENIPGLVFEEVTVKAVGLAVQGPQGPVEGAIRVQEHLMDGTNESKWFAPGYGEFRAVQRADSERVTVALGVPIDTLSGSVPEELRSLWMGAVAISELTPGNWTAVSRTFGQMTAAWNDYSAGDVPPHLEAQMSDALKALGRYVRSQRPARTRGTALDAAHAVLDLQLRYRPLSKVDVDRLGLWARRLTLDVAGHNQTWIAGDVATIETIWDRVGQRDSVELDVTRQSRYLLLGAFLSLLRVVGPEQGCRRFHRDKPAEGSLGQGGVSRGGESDSLTCSLRTISV